MVHKSEVATPLERTASTKILESHSNVTQCHPKLRTQLKAFHNPNAHRNKQLIPDASNLIEL